MNDTCGIVITKENLLTFEKRDDVAHATFYFGVRL